MRRSRVLHVVFAVIAIAFFLTPVALRAVGVTAHPFENRALATAPKLSQGWNVFGQTTRFLTDRMPLREQAVHANNKLWETFFGTEPRYGVAATDNGALPFAGHEVAAAKGKGAAPGGQAGQVLVGKHGWLYLGPELDVECHPVISTRAALRKWETMVSIIRAAGKKAVLIVPPDKGSVYPEYLPSTRLTKCAGKGRRAFWRELAAVPAGKGVVELRTPLLARKSPRGPILYSKHDTHWTTPGAIEMVRASLRRVGGRVRLRRSEIRKHVRDVTEGDLSTLQGKPTKDYRPVVTLLRAPNAPKVPGRTLLIGDSFGDVAFPFLGQYYANVTKIPWEASTPEQLIAAIKASDTVILESVERAVALRASKDGPLRDYFLPRLKLGLKR